MKNSIPLLRIVGLLMATTLVTARLEEEWDVRDPDSAVRLAAMADAQAYVTGGTGILQALIRRFDLPPRIFG